MIFLFAASLHLSNMTLHHKPESIHGCWRTLQELIAFHQWPLPRDFQEIKSTIGWREVESLIENTQCVKLYDEVR